MVGVTEIKEAKDILRKRLSVSHEHKGKYSPDLERASCKKPFLPEEKKEEDKEEERYEPTDWDDSLPYGGKVYLARKKKPLSLFCNLFLASIVVGTLAFLYYGWYYTEHLHYHVTKLYAKMGHREAQSLIGHKLLHGKGVDKDHQEAMKWLYEAALQGHPHAAYNVAVGHLQGIKTDLKPGEARKLIEHAADNGVEEAIEVLEKVCSKGKCDI
ncbi:UNVERIFIED_CONTAM: hypothetical protein RMT77_004593 [Armadillidium vulgare]